MMLKIGLIGCGQQAQKVHIPIWKIIPNVKMTGLYDINESLSKEVASKHDLVVYDSVENLLESDIDVVDVCTPTSTHFELAHRALRANHNVLVEKPITLSSTEAISLIEESKRRNLKLGVVQHHLYSKGIQKIRKLINKGLIGDPIHFDISYPGGIRS